MWKSLSAAIAGLVLVPLLAQAQSRADTSYHRLSWSDFPVNNSAQSAEQARTEGRISYGYRTRSARRGALYMASVAGIEIDSGFDPAASWRRSRLEGDAAALLVHEQGHLDISDIHAAALRNLKPNQFPTGVGPSRAAAEQDLGRRVRTFIDDRLLAMQREQAEYDRDTDHGRNADKQKSWSDSLARALQRAGIR